MMDEEKTEDKVSVYRLHLNPKQEQRRPEWNLILISDIPVTVDFYHTDMMEKVISIRKADIAEVKVEKEEEVEE